MKNFLRQVAFLLLLPALSFAQSGKLSGKVTEKDTKEPVPFAAVQVFQGGALKGGAQADIDGNFTVSPLQPGLYDVRVSFTGFITREIQGVKINFESTTRITVELSGSTVVTKEVEVTTYKVPLITQDEATQKTIITAEKIAKMPSRSISAIATTAANVVSSDVGGDLNIRGNRSGDNAVFVNGVRQFGSTLPPPEAIEELAIVTGGIPAQYGDALGGILSITTKSAPRRFRFGLQGETSSLFDTYNYNLLAGSVSGPIIKIGDTTRNADGIKGTQRTLLGFYSNLQYEYTGDASPSAYGYMIATPATMDLLRSQPVVIGASGTSFIQTGNFFNESNFQRVQANPNSGSYGVTANGTMDFQPLESVLLSVGGNFRYSEARLNGNFNLFNYANAPKAYNYDYNAFFRIRQSFNQGLSASEATIRNIYYQLQFDVQRVEGVLLDPTHGTNLSRYNYVGVFKDSLGDVPLVPGISQSLIRYDPVTGRTDSNFTLTSRPDRLVVFKNQNLGLRFTPGPYNRDMANYNNFIFNQNALFLQNATSNDIASGFLFSRGVGINGSGLPGIGYGYSGFPSAGLFLSNLGETQSNFGYNFQEQYAVSGIAAADIGKHTIKVGFEYQQREIGQWGGATNLYSRGRNLLNRQFTGRQIIDTVFNPNTNQLEVFFSEDAIRDGRSSDRFAGQTDFDYNFRRSLGLNPLGLQRVNIDEFTPDQVNLRQFSVADIWDGGINPITRWIGYDAYGVRNTGNVEWNRFFTDTINRPVSSIRPIYIGGFIEDKFEIEDLILRVGFRFERYDINQPVLRDKYSFTRLRTVGETDLSQFGGNFSRPSTIGDDHVIYVDRDAFGFDGTNQNAFRVRGFRQGDQWFTADGLPTANFNDLTTAGVLFPWFDANPYRNDAILGPLLQRNRITLDAFENYQARWLVLPRISFSFPISENANFFAYYDQLAQRPLSFGGGQNAALPFNYYALSNPGNTINPQFGRQGQYITNPNLQPQTKIDYSAGFQQRLTSSTALKFSAYYSEIKDLIQIVRINGAFPSGYLTDGNQDFSVLRGGSIEYDYRRRNGLEFNASYTLQFSETSASNFAAAQLQSTTTPVLRATLPSAVDPRHAFKLNIDYRLEKGEGPMIGSWKPFQNAGINMVWVAFSGNPYTRFLTDFTQDRIVGSVNGSRLPWNFRADLRIDKTWEFGSGENKHAINAYIYVTNLFDIRNVTGVYPKSGSHLDDGYLSSDISVTQQRNLELQGLSPETYRYYYNLAILNPALVTLPRLARFGIQYSF